jgi:hypothetical protein
MSLRDNPDEQSERIDEACKVADHIFLNAVSRTAEMLDLELPHKPKEIRSVCEEYGDIVAGFMQTITAVYTLSNSGKTRQTES